MAKLYPPILEGVLPAFYSDTIIDGEGEVIKITIPFSMNRAVNSNQVGGFALKIKTVQSSSYLYTVQIYNPLYYQLNDATWVELKLHTTDPTENDIIKKLKVGQFYKMQLAYIYVNEKEKNKQLEAYNRGQIKLEELYANLSSVGEIGHYSTVGIAKYTTKPILKVNDFERGLINTHQYTYTGSYSQLNGDISEKVYSYRFDIYNATNEIIYTSGDQLHNSSNDVNIYESYDEFTMTKDLKYNQNYYIKYTVKTNNLLEVSTPKYRIMQKSTIDPEIKATLHALNNYNEGYLDIALIGEKNADGLEIPVSGSFLLTRSGEDSDYNHWEEISRFKLAGQFPSRWLWRDYTVEQGKNYQYSLQQYNDKNLYSNRMLSNIIYSDFEDAFLYDGNKQLKIKYNPKVSSFKAVTQEAKINTIGSKHPFIFRNGRSYSHEFPISGLISYQMDEAKLFLSKDEFTIHENTTNLTSDNLTQERIFKMEVLKWLTDGKPKLFRSPSEGNFIIRLLNVSLTPNDTLGRMIHTFNATAYEIADYTYENLAKYNFINLINPEIKQLRWETVNFMEKDNNGEYRYRSGDLLNNHLVHTVRFSDMIPGDQIYLRFEDDSEEIIQVGVTGSYYIDTGVAIREIRLESKDQTPVLNGSMTYSYYSIQSNLFDKIDFVTVQETPTRQFLGEYDVIKEIEYVYDSTEKVWKKNPKIDILDIYHINVSKRMNENLIQKNGLYYQDKAGTIQLKPQDADPFTLYRIGYWTQGPGPSSEGNLGYNPSRSQWTFNLEKYIDFYNQNKQYDKNEYQPWVQINDNIISVEDVIVYDVHHPGKLKKLLCGNGANLEISYQFRNIDFNIEYNQGYPDLLKAKEDYELAQAELDNFLKTFNDNNINNFTMKPEDIESKKKYIKMKYDKYILALIKAQEQEKKAEGLL